MPDATLKEACLSAQRALPAWYGKLPGAGDFAERRMPRALAQSWERWFACGISLLSDGAGQASSDPYAHAPIWHFAVPAGAGAGSVQFGCIAPSFDRVGRRYPLLAAHLFDLEGFTLDAASWASERLAALGETLAQAIAHAYGPEQFDRALEDRLSAVPSGGDDDRSRAKAQAWANLLDYFDPGGMTSFWWASADDDDSPAARVHTGALDSALFSALFCEIDRSRRIES